MGYEVIRDIARGMVSLKQEHRISKLLERSGEVRSLVEEQVRCPEDGGCIVTTWGPQAAWAGGVGGGLEGGRREKRPAGS